MKLTPARIRVIHTMVSLALEEESRKENPSLANIIKNTKLYGKKVVKKLTTKEINFVLQTPLINLYYET